eukprot:6174825-Pleurochrysis_carterae.AAC.1
MTTGRDARSVGKRPRSRRPKGRMRVRLCTRLSQRRACVLQQDDTLPLARRWLLGKTCCPAVA